MSDILQQCLAAHLRQHPEDWVPGMACRDPMTGMRWRLYGALVEPFRLSLVAFSQQDGRGWVDIEPSCIGELCKGLSRNAGSSSAARALAAGPDISDAATWGAMFAQYIAAHPGALSISWPASPGIPPDWPTAMAEAWMVWRQAERDEHGNVTKRKPFEEFVRHETVHTIAAVASADPR